MRAGDERREWLFAAGLPVGRLLAWLLLAGTWPAPATKPQGSVRTRPSPQGEARVGRHAMAEDDDTQADSGRHHVGSPEATVSVAALLADALDEGRRCGWRGQSMTLMTFRQLTLATSIRRRFCR